MLGAGFDWLVFDPIHFAMERRMLIGIKELAETGARSRRTNHVRVALWTATFAVFVWAAALVLTRQNWRRPLVGLVAAAATFEMLTLMQPSPLVSLPFVVVAGLVVCHRMPRESKSLAPDAKGRSVINQPGRTWS